MVYVHVVGVGGLTVDNVASKLVLFRDLGIGQCVIGSEPRRRVGRREFHAIGHCGRRRRLWRVNKEGDDSDSGGDVEQCPTFSYKPLSCNWERERSLNP